MKFRVERQGNDLALILIREPNDPPSTPFDNITHEAVTGLFVGIQTKWHGMRLTYISDLPEGCKDGVGNTAGDI